MDWGEAELGYLRSEGQSGISVFKNTIDKAAKLNAEMIAWKVSSGKTNSDPMIKAKEIVKRLNEQGNSTAMQALPALAQNYRKAIAGGNSETISSARMSLISVLLAGGKISPIIAAQNDFDPLAFITEAR